jgi:hypothetical protein
MKHQPIKCMTRLDYVKTHAQLITRKFMQQTTIYTVEFSTVLTLDFVTVLVHMRSLDSSVGIATGYGLDDRGVGVRVPVGSRFFSSPRRPDWLWGQPKSPIQCTGALSPGGKVAGA